MKHLLVYGAGTFSARDISRRFAKQHRQISCFVDKDPNKWGKAAFSGGEIVYSLGEALERYPDYTLYINIRPSMKLDVQEEIVSGGIIPVHRIENYEACEKYLGCDWLEGRLSIFSGSLGFCCADSPFMRNVKMPWNDSKKDIDLWLKLKDKCIDGLKRGDKESPCYGCGKAFNRRYANNKKIRIVSLTQRGICNFRCIYCGYTICNTHFSSKDINTLYSINKHTLELLNECESRTIISPEFSEIDVVTDEFTVYPYKESIYPYLKRYRSSILTNAYVFDKTLYNLLNNDMTRLYVSIDAGTRATFHKIKGVDGFDRVKNNLMKYNEDGERYVELKYIFVPGINDNVEDINGFVALCQDIQPRTVAVSFDRNHKDPIPEHTQKTIKMMIDKLNLHGISTPRNHNLFLKRGDDVHE